MATTGETAKTEIKREVKVVKKSIQKESKVEEQNGDQNGDANVEAELVVKLPTKKTGAKTETKVEVVKRTLPDGSVEEVKMTTTRTTIDGKTEIKTKTETTIIPKDDGEEYEEEEEEEVEEQENGEVVEEDEGETIITEQKKVIKDKPKENGHEVKIIKSEEKSESSTVSSKKVTVVENEPDEDEEEEEEVEEEIEEAEPVTIVLKKQSDAVVEDIDKDNLGEPEEEIKQVEDDKLVTEQTKTQVLEEIEEQEVKPNETEEEEVEVVTVKKEVDESQEQEQEELEEEEEYEQAEESIEDVVEEKKEVEEHEVKKEIEENIKEEVQTKVSDAIPTDQLSEKPSEDVTETLQEVKESPKTTPVLEEKKPEETEPTPQIEIKIPIREASIPLEKVEDVEIKPIGLAPSEVITKSHTEIISNTTEKPSGTLSTQTEYNRIENIVTVNRTTKTLDHSYENLIQQGVPTVKTYFPPSIGRTSSPLPARPYQPVYPPEPVTERRHSLLLERLSVERQLPTDSYQYNNQPTEQQRQWSQEPQSEVVNVSNVKPSTITNQQWYQQQSKNENVIYNNLASSPAPQSWSQPQAPQPPTPQPQKTYKPQPTYAPQPTFTPQPTYTPQQTYAPQQSYTPQPLYQPSYTETVQEKSSNTYSSYKPNNWTPSNNVDSQLNQYSSSFLNKDVSESYEKVSQQYSSTYVPPPWEQDSTYAVNNSQNYYQPSPASTFTAPAAPAPSQSWKPPASKFSKPKPTSYIPPAPNQSFVKTASKVEPTKLPGRKTYYSEYERRYISVPEATYIPSETKFQPQPDPSPQYYYDNNEPAETVEPTWRKELREFTEKTSQTQTTTQTEQYVKPPWEAEAKYDKVPTVTYNPTPSWSQTLRPRSYRERSFESEFVGSQEWPKTNTLGRDRPLSSYGKSLEPSIPERPRGVSVDRYNPNSYQSPPVAEYPPVQTHTLNAPAPHSTYHNPNLPAYHARASAEPRDQPASYKQPRPIHREPRASPIQSRSFKYLQWITGTDE